jgi:hypothetical protein
MSDYITMGLRSAVVLCFVGMLFLFGKPYLRLYYDLEKYSLQVEGMGVLCLCVCVREREAETGRHRDKDRDRGRGRDRDRHREKSK